MLYLLYIFHHFSPREMYREYAIEYNRLSDKGKQFIRRLDLLNI